MQASKKKKKIKRNRAHPQLVFVGRHNVSGVEGIAPSAADNAKKPLVIAWSEVSKLWEDALDTHYGGGRGRNGMNGRVPVSKVEGSNQWVDILPEQACVMRSVRRYFKSECTLDSPYPICPPTIDLRQRKDRAWNTLIEFARYRSYNWLDVVHKNSSRSFPVPSPVTTSTHEEPSTWIDHWGGSHQTTDSSRDVTSRFLTHTFERPSPRGAWDDLKWHTSPRLAFPGFCRIP
jgi:hypothetical protein